MVPLRSMTVMEDRGGKISALLPDIGPQPVEAQDRHRDPDHLAVALRSQGEGQDRKARRTTERVLAHDEAGRR
jgi:hypothetical protein